MAVLMRQDAPGMTSGQFETLFAPIMDQLKTYPGFTANASGPVPGGYQVNEVWESREAHERWMREVILPIVQRAGLGELPPTQYLSLDRYFMR